jgi:hypothetical protein
MTIENKKWTLMFFFASDNILSPSMLTQVKAIKSAGYQKDTNVLLHFDPNEKGAPTRIFEINRSDRRENQPSRIGDCSGPPVTVLTSDDKTPKHVTREQIDAVEAGNALEKFLTFCREQYPADHYMLFMIGHGMVVGRDTFLPDDNPISAIGLTQLGGILNRFAGEIKTHNGVVELIGMHSCSMSGVEVAYELQGTANYMMASQGISFLGAWPYRQMLITLYNAIEAGLADSAEHILEAVKQMHDFCIQHSADFMIGGYSADLCLCTLKPKNVGNLGEPIKSLALALTNGLDDSRCRDLILLAHLKSQGYWQDMYTDLYDFCVCLRRLCVKRDERRPPALQDTRPARPIRRYDQMQKAIEDACVRVMNMLEPREPTDATGPVIRTDFIGAGTQYSHGLSIYFPWTEPVEDKTVAALTNYGNYVFTKSATSPWLEFLKLYFNKTQRPDRLSEDREFHDVDLSYQSGPGFQEAVNAANSAFSIPGVQPGIPQSIPSTALDQKVSPPDAGGDCVCPSFKNYARGFVMSDGPSIVFGASRRPPTAESGSPSIAA